MTSTLSKPKSSKKNQGNFPLANNCRQQYCLT